MQEFERVFEHEAEHRQRPSSLILILAVKGALGKFDVPVAEVAPHKVVQRARRDTQLELAHVEGDLFDAAFSLETIHLSAAESLISPRAGISSPSAFMMTKRDAFQILFMKLRIASTLERL